MKIFFTLGKKSLLVILFSVILGICLLSQISGIVNAVNDGISRKNRTEYLKSIGCYVKSQSETKKDIMIPYDFSDVYINYNEIQKQAGFDLTAYKGCKCQLFSYEVEAFGEIEDIEYFKANIIVYNGRIIGGDISSAKIDGEMYPLRKQDEKAKTGQIRFNTT